jgi:non-specific serine/threonine protein kinase
MLETIRDYAAERLAASGQAEELRRRHAEYFRELAEKLERTLLGISPQPALERLESDHGNIRAALQNLEDSASPQEALEMAARLWEFWCLRAHAPEGAQRLEHLVELEQAPTLVRAKGLTGIAHLGAQVPGHSSDEMVQMAAQALELYRALGDEWWTAFAEFEYAIRLAYHGDFAGALPLAEASVGRLRALGDAHRALQALRTTAWCTLEVHGSERARPIYGQLLDEARAAGDMQLLPRALNVFARFESQDGHHAEALRLMEEAFGIDSEYGDPGELMNDLVYFGSALALAEHGREAITVLAAARARQDELGVVMQNWVVRIADDAERLARTQIDDVACRAAHEAGLRLSVADSVALAEAALSAPPQTTGTTKRR